MAVCLTSLAAALFSLPVETLGTRFGGIPRTLPIPALPALTPDLAMAVLPMRISFALVTWRTPAHVAYAATIEDAKVLLSSPHAL